MRVCVCIYICIYVSIPPPAISNTRNSRDSLTYRSSSVGKGGNRSLGKKEIQSR